NCSGSTNLPRVEAPSFVVDGVAGRSPSDYCSVGKATAAVVDSQHVAALDAVGHQTASAVVGPRTIAVNECPVTATVDRHGTVAVPGSGADKVVVAVVERSGCGRRQAGGQQSRHDDKRSHRGLLCLA